MTTRKEAERIGAEIAGVKKEYVVMSKFSPVPFADEVLKNTKIIYDKNKNLWRYDESEGLWKSNSEQFIKTLIRKNLLGDEQQKRNYVEEIISHIKDTTFNEDFSIDNNPFLIGFNNKVFDLKSEEFIDFKPEFYITNKIKIDVDEEIKECPLIDKFFSDCVGEEYKEILYDLCAYCLFRRYPYPKLFFIHGPANTGKSKFIQLLETFLGEDNRCSVEPQDVQLDPYATAQMIYKLANIASDISYDAMDNINQVKKITGEDNVKIRNMYKEPYNQRIYAKQIFSTNKLPVVKEKTKAWYKRVYTIEFSNIITKQEEDPFLIDKITSEKELKGLAYKCVEHLKRLKNNNFIFTFDIDIVEMEKIYEKFSNPILLFCDETCVKGDNSYVYQWEFKERLINWLAINHFPPMTNSEIKNYMKEKYTESNRPAFNGGKVYRVWSGLRWKGPEDISLNQFNHFNQVSKKVIYIGKKFQNVVKSVKSVKLEELNNEKH